MNAPTAVVDLVSRVGRTVTDALVASWLARAEVDGLHVDDELADLADMLMDAAEARALELAA